MTPHLVTWWMSWLTELLRGVSRWPGFSDHGLPDWANGCGRRARPHLALDGLHEDGFAWFLGQAVVPPHCWGRGWRRVSAAPSRPSGRPPPPCATRRSVHGGDGTLAGKRPRRGRPISSEGGPRSCRRCACAAPPGGCRRAGGGAAGGTMPVRRSPASPMRAVTTVRPLAPPWPSRVCGAVTRVDSMVARRSSTKRPDHPPFSREARREGVPSIWGGELPLTGRWRRGGGSVSPPPWRRWTAPARSGQPSRLEARSLLANERRAVHARRGARFDWSRLRCGAEGAREPVPLRMLSTEVLDRGC